MRPLLAPRLIGAHLLVVAAVGTAGLLGYWQYDAWQERRAAEQVDRTLLEPVPLTEVMGPDDTFPGDQVGRPVRVAGSWLPDATVYVADREHAGADGYWVVTPLTQGDAAAPALPVVRGWVADVDEAPAPPTGTAELVAWLQPTEGTGRTDPDPTDDVLLQIRIGDLVQHVDQDLYGAYGIVDPAATATNPGTDGLEPADLEQLPEVDRFTGIRNLLYALEWWVFGGFALLIWWRYVRDVTADSTSRPAPDDDPVPSKP